MSNDFGMKDGIQNSTKPVTFSVGIASHIFPSSFRKKNEKPIISCYNLPFYTNSRVSFSSLWILELYSSKAINKQHKNDGIIFWRSLWIILVQRWDFNYHLSSMGNKYFLVNNSLQMKKCLQASCIENGLFTRVNWRFPAR